MNDTISVIIPIYNRVNFLPDCMNSLFAQSHQNLQIILIDNGSTDGTLALCRDYAANDSRVLALSGDHSGVSAARNMGLDAATGKYVFFIDSDDAIHPNLLQTLYEAMEAHNAPLGGTLVMNISQSQWSALPSLIARQKPPAQVTFHTHEATVHDIYFGQTPFGLIGGTMMRRDLVGQTRFNEEIFIGEDYLFIYQNLIKGASSVFLRRQWYYAQIHGSNISGNYSYEGFLTRFRRRKLVWESEETLGRPEIAAKEKHSAFTVYLACLQKNRMSKTERKKMCSDMKQHRKIILPALNFPRKVRFWMTVYFPWTHRIYCKLFKKK
jgi:glycosyltransferase involved in cell wall biosynthesis